MKIILLAALFFLEPGKIYIQQFHISTQHTVGLGGRKGPNKKTTLSEKKEDIFNY